MSNKFKDIDTKNLTNYFFDNKINIKVLDPHKIKTDEKSCKNIHSIYYIGYVTFNDLRYVITNSVNHLYLINKIYRYFEEISGLMAQNQRCY